MADSANITRRSALKGAVALSTLPVAAVASAGDQPAKPFDLQEWLDTADPDAVVHYHAGQLAAAMNRVDAAVIHRPDAAKTLHFG